MGPPIRAPLAATLPLATADDLAPPAALPPPDPRISVGKGTRLLVFGDSMVNTGFGASLARRVEALGGSAVTDSVASSTARTWSRGERLMNLLKKSDADVVVIVLGANEVFIPFPAATEGNVRAVVDRLGGRRCLWVGPPVWKYQTGVVEVQRANSAPCAYFDTQGLVLERQPDGIHPDHAGGRAWASAVWDRHFLAADP